METKEINIHEFCGFYNSPLDSMIDDAIEQAFSDREGRGLNKTPDELWSRASFSDCWEKVAKEYAENLNQRIKDWGDSRYDLKLEFKALESPKYYNFETDRLFCSIPDESILFMLDKSKEDEHKTLSRIIAERFTSRSGFISFYDNALSDWPENPLEWDHNQLGALFSAFLELENFGGDDLTEWALMESSQCNGFFESVVWDCFPPEFVAYANFLDSEQEKGVEFESIPEFSEWVEAYKPEETAA